MTIQEVIRTGKPFRLKNWFHLGKPYYAAAVKQEMLPLFIGGTDNKITLHVFEILSNDWESKP